MAIFSRFYVGYSKNTYFCRNKIHEDEEKLDYRHRFPLGIGRHIVQKDQILQMHDDTE